MLGFIKKLFGIETVDVSTLLEEGAVVIDVRTKQEFNGGHAKGSVNIPLHEIQAKMSQIKKYKKPIVTCCASGMRSGTAAKKLRKEGLEVYNGGSWTKVNKLMKK